MTWRSTDPGRCYITFVWASKQKDGPTAANVSPRIFAYWIVAKMLKRSLWSQSFVGQLRSASAWWPFVRWVYSTDVGEIYWSRPCAPTAVDDHRNTSCSLEICLTRLTRRRLPVLLKFGGINLSRTQTKDITLLFLSKPYMLLVDLCGVLT